MGLDLHVCRLPGQSACGLKVEEGHSLVLACGVGRQDAKIHRSNVKCGRAANCSFWGREVFMITRDNAGKPRVV